MPGELMRKILKEVKEIPPLPTVVTKVMQMTKDPEVSAADLNKVISQDQALTANLLKLCNSAYYGLPRVISNVTQAVMYLGFHTVRNLVLTSSMQDVFKSEKGGYGYSSNGLWKNSVACGIAAQLVAKKVRPGLNETAFTAGLLHDVAKVILARFASDQYHAISDTQKKEGIPFIQAEKKVLGFDHAVLGASIADAWNFPQELIQAIGFHHAPATAKGQPILVVITHIADVAALDLGVGLEDPGVKYPLDPVAAESTGFGPNDLPPLIAQLSKSMEEATSFFGT